MPSTRIVDVNVGIDTWPDSLPWVRFALPLKFDPAGSVIDWFSFLTVRLPPTWQLLNGRTTSAADAVDAETAHAATKVTARARTALLARDIGFLPGLRSGSFADGYAQDPETRSGSARQVPNCARRARVALTTIPDWRWWNAQASHRLGPRPRARHARGARRLGVRRPRGP